MKTLLSKLPDEEVSFLWIDWIPDTLVVWVIFMALREKKGRFWKSLFWEMSLLLYSRSCQ